jgi:hypothetical protein
LHPLHSWIGMHQIDSQITKFDLFSSKKTFSLLGLGFE